MRELFNVAFGFALVFMKATLDTDTSALLFACVGRCFTADVLLTRRVTSVEQEPLSARGCFHTVPTRRPGRVSPEGRSPRISTVPSPQPVPKGRRLHLLSRKGTKQAPCSPHGRSHFRRAAAGPPLPAPAFLRAAARRGCATRGGCEAAAKGAQRPPGFSARHRGKGMEPAEWEGLGRTFPAAPCCMPRSRTAPSPPAPAAVPPRAPGLSPLAAPPAALPPWRGRPAAGAGRTRHHSRCQRRYILPEPLPPPSSRHAGLAGLGLSVTERRPGGRAGLSSGPAAWAAEPVRNGPWAVLWASLPTSCSPRYKEGEGDGVRVQHDCTSLFLVPEGLLRATQCCSSVSLTASMRRA